MKAQIILHRQPLVYNNSKYIDQTVHPFSPVSAFPLHYLNWCVRTAKTQTSLHICCVNSHVCLPNNATPFAFGACEQWMNLRIRCNLIRASFIASCIFMYRDLEEHHGIPCEYLIRALSPLEMWLLMYIPSWIFVPYVKLKDPDRKHNSTSWPDVWDRCSEY